NLAGALVGILRDPRTLGLSDAQFGITGTAYLAGSVTGALLFGYAPDRLSPAAPAATAFSWNFASYTIFRALTGAGIGGEYSAINSAVDELIPARVRGHVDLLINSTFWIGAALGSGASLIIL